MKQVFCIVTLVFLANLAFAQPLTDKANPFPKTIAVTGSSEMEITPDEIDVVVDLQEYQKKGQDKISIEKIKSGFLQKCKAIGIPDSAITIASYEGYYDYWQKKKEQVQLYSSISYQVKFSNSIDVDKLVNSLDEQATQNFRIVKT